MRVVCFDKKLCEKSNPEEAIKILIVVIVQQHCIISTKGASIPLLCDTFKYRNIFRCKHKENGKWTTFI